MNLKFGEYQEISEKDFAKILSKIRKFYNHCCVKTELLFMAKDLRTVWVKQKKSKSIKNTALFNL